MPGGSRTRSRHERISLDGHVFEHIGYVGLRMDTMAEPMLVDYVCEILMHY